MYVKANYSQDFFVYISQPFIYISKNTLYAKPIIPVEGFQVTGSYKGEEDDMTLFCKYILL